MNKPKQELWEEYEELINSEARLDKRIEENQKALKLCQALDFLTIPAVYFLRDSQFFILAFIPLVLQVVPQYDHYRLSLLKAVARAQKL